MLFLNSKQVESLLDPGDLVDALAPAMADLSAGSVSMPPRVAASVEERGGFLGVMPVYLPSSDMLSAKLVSIFPGNALAGLHTHSALVAVFDPATGVPLAVMDGTSITAVRTAAGSALATRLLARPDAAVVAVLGTGVQARAHLWAMARVRPVEEFRIAGRNRAHAVSLAAEAERELHVPCRAAQSWQAATAGADIVCAATHSPDPVVRWEWLTAGAHVNSVGLHPDGREVDAETVVNSVVVVESRESTLAAYPSGANELRTPIEDGLITAEHIHAEIGELVAGRRPGRTSPDQVTLYKSVGVAVQDAVAAKLVLDAARARGVGTELDLQVD